jgi:phosphatidylserine/phosphatidylglycerophosphate/cardiolipin synthase-like enzyme
LFQIQAITQAHTSIFIQTPNLTSLALIKALKHALLKHVHVTLYLPRNMMVAESIVTGWTTTYCQIRLLQRWAKRRQVYLEVEWFKGGTEFVMEDKSHIKFMVVDERCVVLGSSNLDRASACTSGEVNIAIENREMATKMLEAVKQHQATGKSSV